MPSRQPRKQRKQRAQAPLHERHAQVRAPLSGDLRADYGTRSTRVNAGDTVEVTRGDFAGETGEVMRVDLRKAVIHVEGVSTERADGEEVPRPLDASNVRITALDLDDPVREERLERNDEDREGGN